MDLADTVGISALQQSLINFGITTDSSDNNLALSLGAMTYGVSPIDMCAAYAALANDGVYNTPHLIRSIYDRHGKLVYSHTPESHQAVSRRSACILTDMLKTAATEGTANALSGLNFPVAAKTGTSGLENGDTTDAWAAVYTPDIAVTVWMGKDNNSNGGLPASVTGGGFCVPVCADFLNMIRSELSCSDFRISPDLCRMLIDRYVLNARQETVLAVSSTPSEYSVYEIFDADVELPYSDIWNPPPPVEELAVASTDGGYPTIEFTATGEFSEYIIVRKCNGISETLDAVDGSIGDIIRYIDYSADTSQINIYTVIPRHRILHECGTVLMGPESKPVEYVPSGLLNGISSLFDSIDISIPETITNPLF